MRGKVAFVFPGQGSQYVGMGREISDAYPAAADVLAAAGVALGEPLAELCFQGPEEKLAQTVYTQPAVLAVSLACWRAWESCGGRQPDFVAGHSLGEYSALVAAGVLSLAEAVVLVRQRALWMEAAYPAGAGGMVACLGLAAEQVEQACARVGGMVVPANYNCPGQVAVAGPWEALDAVAGEIKFQKGRAVRLAVSGPFHSPLMEPAARQLAAALAEVSWSPARVPVVPNVLAEGTDDPGRLKEALRHQVTQPVRWEQSIRWLIAQGVNTFVEVGPGKVLSGLIGRISREVDVFNVEDPGSLQKTLASLGEGG